MKLEGNNYLFSKVDLIEVRKVIIIIITFLNCHAELVSASNSSGYPSATAGFNLQGNVISKQVWDYNSVSLVSHSQSGTLLIKYNLAYLE